MLTQATAIIRYLGKKAQLYPTNDFEAAKVDEVLNIVEEATPIFLKPWVTPEGAEKTHLMKQMKEEILPTFLGKFENLLEINGGTYLVGKEMTVADLVLWKFIGMVFKDKFYPNQPEEILDRFHRVKENFTAVNNAEKVVAWKKKTPEVYHY